MAMRVEFVNNAGPNTVESVIRGLARSARSLYAVVAFATKAGVDALLPYLRDIAERGQVSVTVGLYQGVTEPSALRALAKAAKTTAGRLTVSVARTPNLHRKVLRSAGEFNVLLQTLLAGSEMAAKSPEARQPT